MSNRTDELKRQIANARAPRMNHDINILGARLSERQLAEKEFKEWLEQNFAIEYINGCNLCESRNEIIKEKIAELSGEANG